MFKPRSSSSSSRDSHRLLLKASEFKTKRAIKRIRFSSLFSSLARRTQKKRERVRERENVRPVLCAWTIASAFCPSLATSRRNERNFHPRRREKKKKKKKKRNGNIDALFWSASSKNNSRVISFSTPLRTTSNRERYRFTRRSRRERFTNRFWF